MLSRIVEWYNDIKVGTEPCEFNIIKKEVEMIDNKLTIAIGLATWSDYEQVYITDVHADIKNLHTRTMRAKKNVEVIIESLNLWGKKPMYTRHDGDPKNLMIPENFTAMIERRQLDCKHSKMLIDCIMDENFRLLFNLELRPEPPKKETKKRKSTIMESMEGIKSSDEHEEAVNIDRPSETNVGETDKAAQVSTSLTNIKSIPSHIKNCMLSSEVEADVIKTPSQLVLFRPYEEYIDGEIWKEIEKALKESMKYVKYEMENRKGRNIPLFDVKLELLVPRIVYLPTMNMNMSNPQGLLEIITTMIANILNMSDMIPLVAQPSQRSSLNDLPETFTIKLEAVDRRKSMELNELEDMQLDITALTRQTIREAIVFAEQFEKYNFLWSTDKVQYLENFLKYGRVLTSEELAEIDEGTSDIKYQNPELEEFRKVIEYYTKLYEEINKIETIKIFNAWLQVDLKGLKHNLLNQVCKWSFMFKQHLKDKVINDLNELAEFITESTMSLKQEATNEDSATLLKILKTLSSIYERERRTDNMFEPLKEIVDLLRSYEMTFEDRINNQFAELPEKWITLKKLAMLVKRSIGPVQAYQVDLIKKRISLFDLRTKLYHEKFMRSPFFSVPCSNVYQLCDRVNNELCDMEAQNLSLRESAVHFQLNSPEEGKLIQCRRLVKMVKQIWDFMYAVESCIDDWKRTPWKKINVEDMETECKKFSKDMRNFDKEMKMLKPYLETEAMIKNLLTSLRAITELQNPAIRERHWIELMVATKVRILSVLFSFISIASIRKKHWINLKKKEMRDVSLFLLKSFTN